ncbi:MAG TPA: papain-like cysteine protease family protein [Candidatus Limnocylindrales bacterium]|nr:papain-like cysteine protease family protein [Candidatus Limnocylindrales bacterium]
MANLTLRVERQMMSEWCWAAVSVSVDRFFRPDSTHTQCEIAGLVLKKICCPGQLNVQTDACNVPGFLGSVFGKLHLLEGDPGDKPLPFADIQKEIDGGRPVCVLIKWLESDGKPGTRGHFIVIQGYTVTPAQKQFVSIGDPLYGSSSLEYGQFADPKGGYRDGRGVWSFTYLTGRATGAQ